ncbi:carboxylesterase family protein [Actinoplanes sp. TRM 88003]|uniref:Carboxylic ester hydrolase n=1 Tax=Paractinoplanes aksuensis TaxID=2939490 RepID=A0ABT1DQ35_9ACTN|nr:carboxylesterase family protein [Actinoplanes aksuensis]MCO8272949.1 carboxylesterase family protein [Actinoplanes aksuensis]
MLWIHGGGFRLGGADETDPRALAAENDLVVVSINYRLAALGFLSAPSLDGAGSFGLLDQQAALRWVHDNIAEFGGDPDRVTLYGISAGGDSVCSHLASPASKVCSTGRSSAVPPATAPTRSTCWCPASGRPATRGRNARWPTGSAPRSASSTAVTTRPR